MATIPMQARSLDNARATSVAWLGLGQGDDGEAVGPFPGADRSVQVTGVFGAGGAAVIEGSNDDDKANWFTLTDPQGNPLSFTTARLEQISENTRWLRARVSAGDGTTALDVRMFVTR
jgi:hypothetical protein